jgi:hypothetical protein
LDFRLTHLTHAPLPCAAFLTNGTDGRQWLLTGKNNAKQAAKMRKRAAWRNIMFNRRLTRFPPARRQAKKKSRGRRLSGV